MAKPGREIVQLGNLYGRNWGMSAAGEAFRRILSSPRHFSGLIGDSVPRHANGSAQVRMPLLVGGTARVRVAAGAFQIPQTGSGREMWNIRRSAWPPAKRSAPGPAALSRVWPDSPSGTPPASPGITATADTATRSGRARPAVTPPSRHSWFHWQATPQQAQRDLPAWSSARTA